MSALTDLQVEFQAMHDDALKLEQAAQAHRVGVEAALAKVNAEIGRKPTLDDLKAMLNRITE